MWDKLVTRKTGRLLIILPIFNAVPSARDRGSQAFHVGFSVSAQIYLDSLNLLMMMDCRWWNPYISCKTVGPFAHTFFLWTMHLWMWRTELFQNAPLWHNHDTLTWVTFPVFCCYCPTLCEMCCWHSEWAYIYRNALSWWGKTSCLWTFFNWVYIKKDQLIITHKCK